MITVVEPTIAEAVHASTLASPRHMASNVDMLDRAAPETIETLTVKAQIIEKCKAAFAAVRGYRLGLGPLQAAVVGYLAELLPLKPTNKELAAAMLEPYDEATDGPDAVTLTIHTPEYVKFGVDRDPKNPESELSTPVDKKGVATHPKPYAQAARRYKFLAQIEAKLPGEDSLGNLWDLSKVSSGVIINSVTYASPVAALMSGVVSMEAVFQAWSNVLTPKIVDFRVWNTGHVEAAKAYAPKVKVIVRQFNKKMNRDQKASVTAVHSASVLYGLIMGLLEPVADETKDPVFIGRERADKIIDAVNARVDVRDAEPTK